MSFKIVRAFHYDGELIGTSTRGLASPNTYETAGLALKLASRMAIAEDDELVQFYVTRAADPYWRPYHPPVAPLGDYQDDETEIIPW